MRNDDENPADKVAGAAAVKLVEVHARLFADDVAELKRIAAERRVSWQTELRQLVHRALKGDRREVVVLKD